MSRPIIRKTLKAAPVAFALATSHAEAATPVHQPPASRTETALSAHEHLEQQIKFLAQSALAIPGAEKTVTISKDKHGRPVVETDVNISLRPTADATGKFSFEYETVAGKPHSLLIEGDSSKADGAVAQTKIDYTLNSSNHSLNIGVKDTHISSSSSSTAHGGIDGASSESFTPFVIHANNPREEKFFEHVLLPLGGSVVNAAAEGEPLSDMPHHRLPSA